MYHAWEVFSLMNSGDNSYRSSKPASRPPQFDSADDTPLFTDIFSTPSRRTPNNGRPENSNSSGARTSRPSAASPYGGRSYSSSGGSRASAPSTGRPGQQSRATPVYTELSWNDLRRGSDYSELGRPTQPQTPPPARDTGRSNSSSYFGGFEQEMEKLFYNAEKPAADQASPTDRSPQAPPERVPQRQYVSSQPADRPAQRQYAPSQPAARPASRQSTPFQSIRNTAYRQATRSSSRQTSQGTPVAPRTGTRRSAGSIPPPANGGNHVNYGARSRGRRIHPAFYLAGFALMALLVFGLARLAAGSGNKNTPSATVRPVYTSAPPTEIPAGAETTPGTTPAATPTPSPEPTPTPSGPKAKRSGDLIIPADWGATVPERKKTVYDSYFDRSIMIGNSMVEGFFMWAGMEKNLAFVYGTGATVANAVGGMDLAKITLNASDYYTDIYLMFGLNEIGTDVNSFVQNYKRLVDFIREHQTKANIYIISVTPVTRQVDEDPNEVQNMDRIRLFNAALQEFCVDQGCWYLDIYHLLLDDNGYLSGDYAYIGDGKHFEKSGYVAWANYMKTHYVDEGLLTE